MAKDCSITKLKGSLNSAALDKLNCFRVTVLNSSEQFGITPARIDGIAGGVIVSSNKPFSVIELNGETIATNVTYYVSPEHEGTITSYIVPSENNQVFYVNREKLYGINSRNYGSWSYNTHVTITDIGPLSYAQKLGSVDMSDNMGLGGTYEFNNAISLVEFKVNKYNAGAKADIRANITGVNFPKLTQMYVQNTHVFGNIESALMPVITRLRIYNCDIEGDLKIWAENQNRESGSCEVVWYSPMGNTLCTWNGQPIGEVIGGNNNATITWTDGVPSIA